MRKTFLMCASVTVKSNFMIVYQNPQEIFYYSSLYAFMPFFPMGKVKYLFLIWRCADKYISAFSIYTGICTVCMQNWAGQQVRKEFFRYVSALEENLRQSLLIIPLEIFHYRYEERYDYREDFYHAFLAGILTGAGYMVGSNRDMVKGGVMWW